MTYSPTLNLCRHEAGHLLAAIATKPEVTTVAVEQDDDSDGCLAKCMDANGERVCSVEITLGGIAASAALDDRPAKFGFDVPTPVRLAYPSFVIGLPGAGDTCRFDVAVLTDHFHQHNVGWPSDAIALMLRPLAMLAFEHGEELAHEIRNNFPFETDADRIRERIMPTWRRIEANKQRRAAA